MYEIFQTGVNLPCMIVVIKSRETATCSCLFSSLLLPLQSIQPSVQSTPQKASQSCSLSKRSNMKSTDMWSKSEYVLPVGEHKMELKALLLLATSFDLTDLKNK